MATRAHEEDAFEEQASLDTPQGGTPREKEPAEDPTPVQEEKAEETPGNIETTETETVKAEETPTEVNDEGEPEAKPDQEIEDVDNFEDKVAEEVVEQTEHKEAQKNEGEAADAGERSEQTVVPQEESVSESTESKEEANEEDEQAVVQSEAQTEAVSQPASTSEGERDGEPADSPETHLGQTEPSGKANEEAREEETKEEDYKDTDFMKLGADELVAIAKVLAQYKDVMKADVVLRKIVPRMDALKKQSRDEVLKAYIEEHESEEGFTYKQDVVFDDFDANFRLIKDRKSQYVKQAEREKELNLAKAEDVLDRLRQFLEHPEDSNSFKKFKAFQEEWKAIGQVPGSNYKTLWANYNALVSLFYDRRSIYFELIDLDRKKNLEHKLKLCERAEALDNVDALREAIVQLNELHHEFKHTGPVPRDEQEKVWLRFKAASDKIYAKRKEFNIGLKKELDENLEKKQGIVERVSDYAEFSSEKIKEWNQKTREIMDLQKAWEKVGGVPRDKAKALNKRFWGPFKQYFHNKNQFFKKLEGDRQVNLGLKQKLVASANALKDSTEWEKTANELKRLQREWREIGPVPEKFRNEIFQQFKSACDHFFTNRRTSSSEAEVQYGKNLELKKEVVNQIEKAKEHSLDKLKELKASFYEIGFVPRKEIANIQESFSAAVETYLGKIKDLSDDEKEKELSAQKVERIKHGPNANKKLNQKEHGLRKQINKIENDITVWKNNIEFFANTKNAEKLKEEFQVKIDNAGKELEKLKAELKMYASA